MKSALPPIPLKLLLCMVVSCAFGNLQAQTIRTVGSGGDYTNITTAFQAINNGILTGDIELQVISNTTESNGTMLNASGSGSANYTSVYIYPTGGAARTIGGNISIATIYLNGADNVRINGLNTGGNSLTITNRTGANDDFSVRVLNGVRQNGLTGPFGEGPRIQATWDISKTNPNGGSGVNMEFRWDPAQNDRITTPALFHYGTSWDPVVSGIGSSPNSTTLSHTDYLGTFSPFAIGQLSGTLPVVWKSFTAEKRNTNVFLRWETSSETNTKKYVVEHSTNGRTWQPIGDVAAAGNSSIVTSYEFVHVQPSAGNNHYRIRQIDLDDKFSWSRVEVIRFDMRSSILVHPNPTTNQLVVEQRGGSITNGTLRMMDIHGKVIRTLPLTQIRTILDVSALSAGMYFIQLNQDAPIGFIKQ